jgi:hypothetical protein
LGHGKISLVAELAEAIMATKRQRAEQAGPSKKVVDQLAAAVRREVRAKLGPDSTFEQRRDAAAELMREVLWKEADTDLRESVTDADEVEVDDKRYRRLEQPSAATYFGRWGPHTIEEALYREVGVHNGPTIKPIELRVGIIEHMTPDMARVVGELSADRSSRSVGKTLHAVGLSAPSRAFLEKHTKEMSGEIADMAASLEKSARAAGAPPAAVASLSCGLDRFSVRMSEEVDAGQARPTPRARTEPYERTPPAPKEHHYRKAWVGTTTAYDEEGNALHTWKYAVEAEADRNALADRVAADVAWLLSANSGIPVHCVQDAAPELRALPEALSRILPANTQHRELVDLEHLMDYLEDVVDACEPEGDPHDWKQWYRGELLRDDHAIDRIWQKLRRQAKTLPRDNTRARDAVAAALRYIRKRKAKMRYASFYAANLPIGSGATESTCWQMQQRVKLPGQSWEPRGLRGVLAVRGLVLSERWSTAWEPYAATHRKEVRLAA